MIAQLFLTQETCLASWQSVKAAFIFTSIVSCTGGLYISPLGSMATSERTPLFHRGDFQKTLPPGGECLAFRRHATVGEPSLVPTNWQPMMDASKLASISWLPVTGLSWEVMHASQVASALHGRPSYKAYGHGGNTRENQRNPTTKPMSMKLRNCDHQSLHEGIAVAIHSAGVKANHQILHHEISGWLPKLSFKVVLEITQGIVCWK